MDRFRHRKSLRAPTALACTLILAALQPASAQMPYGYSERPRARAPEGIPRAYRGRWAPDPDACRTQDHTGRMRVTANGVNGWDYGARPVTVTPTGNNRSIRLSLAYEGEGESWIATEVWALGERGERLSITVESGSTHELVRCT